MTTADNIARLDALATPGPWEAGLNTVPYADLEFECWTVDAPEVGGVATVDGPKDMREADAALIVTLRNAVPEILAALRAAQPLADVAGLVADRADWLLDAVACATQDRQFLRGDPEYNEVAGEAILLNGAKAIRVALSRSLEELEAENARLREVLQAISTHRYDAGGAYEMVKIARAALGGSTDVKA